MWNLKTKLSSYRLVIDRVNQREWEIGEGI